MKLGVSIILVLLCFQFGYSQKKNYKYLYVQQYSDSIFSEYSKIDSVIRIFTNKNEEAKQMEKNLFRISKKSKLKNLFIKIGNQTISLNLKKYDANRFFNIKIFINPDRKGNLIFKFKIGDLIRIQKNNCNAGCGVIQIDFPQVIIIKNEATLRGNDIFQKYIFD